MSGKLQVCRANHYLQEVPVKPGPHRTRQRYPAMFATCSGAWRRLSRAETRSDGRKRGRNSADGCGEDRALDGRAVSCGRRQSDGRETTLSDTGILRKLALQPSMLSVVMGRQIKQSVRTVIGNLHLESEDGRGGHTHFVCRPCKTSAIIPLISLSVHSLWLSPIHMHIAEFSRLLTVLLSAQIGIPRISQRKSNVSN